MRYGRGGLLGSSAKTTNVSLNSLYFCDGLFTSTVGQDASNAAAPSSETPLRTYAESSPDHVSAVYVRQYRLAHAAFF